MTALRALCAIRRARHRASGPVPLYLIYLSYVLGVPAMPCVTLVIYVLNAIGIIPHLYQVGLVWVYLLERTSGR